MIIINREDAVDIVAMAEVCYGEGIGPDYNPLLIRLVQEFGRDIVPKYLWDAIDPNYQTKVEG